MMGNINNTLDKTQKSYDSYITPSGIVRENDRFLYGEKVKAYLIRGARRISGIQSYPDERVGWGALCVKNSLPG